MIACPPADDELPAELVLADAVLAAVVLAPPPPPGEVEAPAVDSFASEGEQDEQLRVVGRPPAQRRQSRTKALARLGLSEEDAGKCIPSREARPTLRQRALSVLGIAPEREVSRINALVRMGLPEEKRPAPGTERVAAGAAHARGQRSPPQNANAVNVLGYETEEQLQRRKALKRMGTSEEELIVAANNTRESERARRPSQARSLFASMRDRRDRRGQHDQHDQPEKPKPPRRSTSQLCMLALRGGVFV